MTVHGLKTAQFPEIVAAVAGGVTARHAIVDGELVVLSPDGRPDFYVAMARHGQGRAERSARAVAGRNLEGIVAKRLDSPYRPDTRCQEWRRLKLWHEAEMTILAVRREPFGAIIGEPGKPVAMVELGWRPHDRRALHGLVGELKEREEGDLTWLRPVLKCQLRYRTTPDGKIREPVFDGWPSVDAA